MKLIKTSLLLSLILIMSCGGKQPMLKTVNDLIQAMEPHTRVIILGDPDGALLAVTPEYGAKVIAMAVDGTRGKNLLWPNPKIWTKEFWSGPKLDWNLGGARTWIAPEADFYLDRDKNWFVPEAMDPGHYQLDRQEPKLVQCSNEFHVSNNKDQHFHLKIVRTIELLDQRPNFVSANLQYVGLKFTHELINLAKQTIGKDLDDVSLWSLIQLDTAGTMIIPIKHDSAHQNIIVRDYGPTNFNTVPPDRITIADDYISVKIDGKFRCKLGFAPWAARNGIAYLSYQKNSDQGILFLKQFDVDPHGIYLDHPWEKPYDYGDAIQMYNDDGRFGGFCEIECHAPAKLLAPNEKLSHTVIFSIIVGPLENLKQVAADQLKINMDQVVLY
ncbi:MAG: hypothetical protein ONB31_04855 [candidate division KSB1 bacterium]|nr:hypothetical protein [candidate division KSB1 bacterium]MDZ7336260.1 hypothetical protein [candidate division KSB1 bacterium]MDZ7401446.1 hypothetical protein [candidate division KSB1 bacterium]